MNSCLPENRHASGAMLKLLSSVLITTLVVCFSNQALGQTDGMTNTYTLVDFVDVKPNVHITANIADNPNHSKEITKTISVEDSTTGLIPDWIEQREIEEALNTAKLMLRDSDDEIIGVKLDYVTQELDEDGNPVPQMIYDLKETLRIPSGVALIGAPDGDGHTFGNRRVLRCLVDNSVGNKGYSIGNIRFASKTSHAGIYGLRFFSSGTSNRAGIVVNGSSHIYVSNCTLIDESAAIRDQENPDDALLSPSMLLIEHNRTAFIPDDVRPGATCSDIYISNNLFRYVRSGIQCFASDLDGVVIQGNQFMDWRSNAISFKRLPLGAHGAKNIEIYDNEIFPPKSGKLPRQPIAFQKKNYDKVDESDPWELPVFPNRFFSVEILENSVVGTVDLPNVHDVEVISTDPKVLSFERDATSGTADMISLHWVNKYRIHDNYVVNGGEVGINVSNGTRNGKIESNTIVNNDGPAINVGVNIRRLGNVVDASYSGIYQRYYTVEELLAHTTFNQELVRNVTVQLNSIENSALNRSTRLRDSNDDLIYPKDMSVPPYARSGVLVSAVFNATVRYNTISDLTPENYLDTAYYLDLNGAIRTDHRSRKEATEDVILERFGVTPSLVPSGLMQGVNYINYSGTTSPSELNIILSNNPFVVDEVIEPLEDRTQND